MNIMFLFLSLSGRVTFCNNDRHSENGDISTTDLSISDFCGSGVTDPATKAGLLTMPFGSASFFDPRFQITLGARCFGKVFWKCFFLVETQVETQGFGIENLNDVDVSFQK